MPERRPNLFVASSTEALPVARAVKQNFDREADVDIWNENIFKINRGYLDTLLNRASYYDYCIAVFTPDDEAVIREKLVKVSRDNVIFELGLFLGRLGPDRTFLLAQEGVEMFSDWSGIEMATFRPRDNLVAAVGAACDKIREEMALAERREHFSMLPSTSLAIGYYTNFLQKVFDAFEQLDEYQVIERDDRGKVVRETTYPIRDRYPTIHVMLPRDLSELRPEALRRRTAAYKQIAVSTKFRGFPFYIAGDLEAGQPPTLFDIPTTMYSSRIAIEKIFRDDFLKRGDTLRLLEDREIHNFERTLRIMVPDRIEHQYLRFSVLE